LEWLTEPDLGVVVTGQQVGLFLGPALGLYKAATAITLARRNPGSTVPVFWLQSEDHDAQEVCCVNVLDAEHELRSIALDAGGHARASMAERHLSAGVTQAVEQLADALAGAPHRDEALSLVRAHYQPGAGWVEAFGGALASVFAEEGLLVFNPRTSAVAEAALPIHRQVFAQPEALDAALSEGVRALESIGKRPQVKHRPGCSLSFVHLQGRDGDRHRLEHTPAGWRLPATNEILPTSTLLAQLERNPLLFSTSSLLRVVVQQALFPTITQVAGPAEALYLQQVPPLLNAFGVPALHVTPRARIVLSDARTDRRLAGLGLTAAVFDGPERILRKLAERDPGVRGDDVLAGLHAATEHALEEWSDGVLELDRDLERALARTRNHIAKGAARLAARIDQARARRDETRVATVERLGRVLTPGGKPQERTLGAIHWIAHLGLERFKSKIFAAVETHLDHLDNAPPVDDRQLSPVVEVSW
jgi:bacillithiol biosynthesis cysteine-adding enzyme BshC